MGAIRDWSRMLTSEDQIRDTVERLESEGQLSAASAERLRITLAATIDDSRYVLGHLGAHLALGVIFAFDVIPLPLGMTSRALWVVGNRVRESALGRSDLARVHSAAVLGVSLLPFVGNFAYLIPLRTRNAEATFLFANHLSYLRFGRSLSALLGGKPAWMQRLVKAILNSPLQPAAAPPHDD